jgi:hypothetical protein
MAPEAGPYSDRGRYWQRYALHPLTGTFLRPNRFLEY